MREWLQRHELPLEDDDALRFLLAGVAEVAAGRTARMEFDQPDGVTAIITSDDARRILRPS
jgi:hypothetical protein